MLHREETNLLLAGEKNTYMLLLRCNSAFLGHLQPPWLGEQLASLSGDGGDKKIANREMEEDKWPFKRRMGMWGREESQTEVAK